MGDASTPRQQMLAVMKEMIKSNKFVEKNNLFGIVQSKVDR
jgi:hypothetical protein